MPPPFFFLFFSAKSIAELGCTAEESISLMKNSNDAAKAQGLKPVDFSSDTVKGGGESKTDADAGADVVEGDGQTNTPSLALAAFTALMVSAVILRTR